MGGAAWLSGPDMRGTRASRKDPKWKSRISFVASKQASDDDKPNASGADELEEAAKCATDLGGGVGERMLT